MNAAGRVPSVALARGTVLGERYRLERPLGEGGMGTVWAARDDVTGRAVAVKLVKDDEAHADRNRRFAREARAAMAIEHPNVVRILDVQGDVAPDGTPPYLVMELLDGETLETRLARSGKLSLEQACGLMLPVAAAVGSAHAIGVVHRDLKPANIFLCSDGRACVLDFGIAKLTFQSGGDTEEALTRSGDRLGTPRYMSPEQVRGERDLDHRTDVWSLGVVLYECLAGAHPIRESGAARVFHAITTATFASLRDTDPSLPSDVTELVARMLSRERRKRPIDLHEVTEVLARHGRAETPSFAPPAPELVRDEDWRSASTVDDTIHERATPGESQRAGASLPWTLVAIVVGLAALALLVAMLAR